jgi:hypothetical protein
MTIRRRTDNIMTIRRRTDNIMTIRRRTDNIMTKEKGQITIYKTPRTKPKIEQHELH